MNTPYPGDPGQAHAPLGVGTGGGPPDGVHGGLSWTPPTWLALQHPRPLPCERPECAEQPHDARQHLDQRHERYDGPGSTFTVLPGLVRDSARRIAREHPEVMPEVVDMAHEILRLRDQVAAVQVNGDRAVREAGQKALDCEEHGKVIAQIEGQRDSLDAGMHKAERGRLALLDFLHQVDDAVTALRERQRAGRDVPTLDELLTAIESASKKTHAAHYRAWSK